MIESKISPIAYIIHGENRATLLDSGAGGDDRTSSGFDKRLIR
jgi:hypothetical protein